MVLAEVNVKREQLGRGVGGRGRATFYRPKMIQMS